MSSRNGRHLVRLNAQRGAPILNLRPHINLDFLEFRVNVRTMAYTLVPRLVEDQLGLKVLLGGFFNRFCNFYI